MKYIRTKDNIQAFNDSCDLQYVYLSIGGIKIADTIEELCDEFVVEYTNTEPTMFGSFYHLQRHYDLYRRDYHHVAGRYGCIWVAGKGLIYVAKMNNEGELELLGKD